MITFNKIITLKEIMPLISLKTLCLTLNALVPSSWPLSEAVLQGLFHESLHCTILVPPSPESIQHVYMHVHFD